MLQKSNTWKILEIFFNEPTKYHYLIDISRKIKLAHTSVKDVLNELIKEELILKIVEKKGRRNFPLYKANLSEKRFKRYKRIFNIYSLLESGLIEYIEEKLSPKSVVLFGSYEHGDDDEESDIDIYLECKKEEIETEKFEKKLKRKLQLHFNERFSTYSNELKNNIINGFILSGFLEGYK
mgnify:CR=1 FL=1